LKCTVPVKVCAGTPDYTAPEALTATYGDTFGDVAIPAGDNDGTFEWIYSPVQSVGEVGVYTYYVNFVPTDSVNYQKVTQIPVQLTVEPARATYNKITSLTAMCNATLADVQLPDSDVGRYQWVTDATTVPKNGVSYKVVFRPNDTVNYKWTDVEGWDTAWQGVVFSVPTTIGHAYAAYEYDATYHWQKCNNGCGTASAKSTHAWNTGVITKAPTTTATGVKTYTCQCGATKTETIAKLQASGQGSTTNPSGGTSAGDASDSLPTVGKSFKDSKTKAYYKITKLGKEVTFVKPTKKTYTKVTVPKTVKYEGVTYKVTAIANNACKSNKKLKTVVIGDNVKTIGTKAFYGCTKLTKVTIGKNVTTVGNSAFQSCSALKSITIPSKVSKIGSKAFYGCKKLVKMTIKTSKLTEKKVGSKAFTKMGSSNYKKVTVKVPKKKVSAYKKIFKKKGLSSKAKVSK